MNGVPRPITPMYSRGGTTILSTLNTCVCRRGFTRKTIYLRSLTSDTPVD